MVLIDEKGNDKNVVAFSLEHFSSQEGEEVRCFNPIISYVTCLNTNSCTVRHIGQATDEPYYGVMEGFQRCYTRGPVYEPLEYCNRDKIARFEVVCPPSPTPEECNYEVIEQVSDPSGYGELQCDLCQDGRDNDCEYGTDYTDFKCLACTSPIVIDILGDGIDLTSAEGGVDFDIAGVGRPIRISWTQGDDALLVLDRNGNGTVDSGRELFGGVTFQAPSTERNGFLAFAEFDKLFNGGNSDGFINRRDDIFDSLRLWQDVNHNGVSESNELFTLPQLGLRKIELDYTESRRTDEHGNRFKYRARVRDANDAQLGRWAWDVFLVTQP